MDFGISAAFRGDAGDLHITRAGSLVGTPAFMAPEQARPGAMNGPELDLYAVGVMLYWMLSGRLPFRGTPMEMLAAKATVEPPPLDVEGLDPDLEAAVGRLIAKEPHQRFALAGQARRRLEVHATPLKITDDWKSQLFASRPRFSKRAPMPTPWSPPGADTLERAWPTLVIAPPVPQVVQTLPGRAAVLRSIEAVALRVERGDLGLISVLGESCTVFLRQYPGGGCSAGCGAYAGCVGDEPCRSARGC
jgi:serine/threonine-protein kinase